MLIAVISYIPYYKDLFANKTRPHAFSWFVWSVITVIIFLAQLAEGGGIGSFVTGVSAVLCTTVFLFALIKGDRKFVLFDWIALGIAFIGIILWRTTKDPTLAVVLVTVADGFGFLPTIRKAYYKPYEETLSLYVLTTAKWIFGFFGLESLSVATWFFPLYLFFANLFFVILLIVRRRALH